jgi:hypothetical protein
MTPFRLAGESGSGRENGLIAGVEDWSHQKDSGDAANHLAEVRGFFCVKRTTEERKFAVAKPLLEDLVAAEGGL